MRISVELDTDNPQHMALLDQLLAGHHPQPEAEPSPAPPAPAPVADPPPAPSPAPQQPAPTPEPSPQPVTGDHAADLRNRLMAVFQEYYSKDANAAMALAGTLRQSNGDNSETWTVPQLQDAITKYEAQLRF